MDTKNGGFEIQRRGVCDRRGCHGCLQRAGDGFLEAEYQEALEIELSMRGIPFEHQTSLAIHYKGKRLSKEYLAELICYGKIIVELKALDQLAGKEAAQIINYLKATRLRVGVLINFGNPKKLEWKRFVN
jgi:GxxExxY protein